MISQWNTPYTKAINAGGKYLHSIPIDLIIEILLRLPSKTIARFHCVSKIWASILRRPYFPEWFLKRSSSRPQILFAFRKRKDMFFFSIPQLQNHEEKLSHVTATYVARAPNSSSFSRCIHINGLLFLIEVFRNGELFSEICNPNTGQSLAIPRLSYKMRNCFLGYDPIEKQYKILSLFMTSCEILTLGSGNLVWRNIVCCTEHYPLCFGICIDGVLYYRADGLNKSQNMMVVNFDIRTETFQFTKVMENFSKTMQKMTTLINYNGK